MRSGWTELRTAVGDVMDRRPLKLDSKENHPVADEIDHFLRRLPWVKDVIVRVRERGPEFTAEAHVVQTMIKSPSKTCRELESWRAASTRASLMSPLHR